MFNSYTLKADSSPSDFVLWVFPYGQPIDTAWLELEVCIMVQVNSTTAQSEALLTLPTANCRGLPNLTLAHSLICDVVFPIKLNIINYIHPLA